MKYKLDDARNSLSRKVRKSRDEEIDAFLTRKRDQDHWIDGGFWKRRTDG